MSFRILLPKLKDKDDEVEVRKVLVSLEAKINEMETVSESQAARILALEVLCQPN